MDTLSPDQGQDFEAKDVDLTPAPRNRQDYLDTAGEIIDSLNYASNKGMDRHAAISDLWESYVTDEPDPEKAQFAGVLLAAPQARENEATINNYRERRRVGRISAEEYQHFNHLKDDGIVFNHSLRDMLATQRDGFLRKDLVSWIATMTKDNKFAEGIVDGALAEIATMEAASDMNELFEFVATGTLEDDMRGGDVVARTRVGNNPVSIDVKAGKQIPIGHEDQRGVHLTVGVPTNIWDEHGTVDESGREGIKHLISLAYSQRTKAEKSA